MYLQQQQQQQVQQQEVHQQQVNADLRVSLANIVCLSTGRDTLERKKNID